MKVLFDGVLALEGIAANRVVTASVLSRDLVTRVVRRLQAAGRSQSHVYSVARSTLEMWRWVADDPANYPDTCRSTPSRAAASAPSSATPGSGSSRWSACAAVTSIWYGEVQGGEGGDVDQPSVPLARR